MGASYARSVLQGAKGPEALRYPSRGARGVPIWKFSSRLLCYSPDTSDSHCGDGDEGVPYSTVMSLVLFTLFNDQIYLVKHLCDSNRTLGGRTLSWDDGTAATVCGTRPAASYIRPNHSGATISRQCTPTDAPLLR